MINLNDLFFSTKESLESYKQTGKNIYLADALLKYEDYKKQGGKKTIILLEEQKSESDHMKKITKKIMPEYNDVFIGIYEDTPTSNLVHYTSTIEEASRWVGCHVQALYKSLKLQGIMKAKGYIVERVKL